MNIQQFIEQKQIKPNDIIYLVEKKELDKYLKKTKASYEDWLSLHLFIAEKSDVLTSPIYEDIKKWNIVNIQKGKKSQGDDYTLVVEKANLSKKYIQANIPILRPLI